MNLRTKITLLVVLAGVVATTQVSTAAQNASGAQSRINLVYSPEVYDSMVANLNAKNAIAVQESFFKEYINIKIDTTITSNIPDEVYMERLQRLVSPIHLPYNAVIKNYIIRYTAPQSRGTMSRVLGLAQYYFPMFEQELARQRMPLELRMLAVIESALNPSAVSSAGATGLWQFMYTTGKSYDLEITSFIDQRRDPVAATRAACQYLKDLYGMYNDWTLALAAYNCGPGNVNKALKRAGTGAKTYWDIYPFLPAETRGYIPAFVAATYAYTYHKQHQIIPYAIAIPLATDTIFVNKLMHLEQISSTIGISLDDLRGLNPQFQMDIIPAFDKPYSIVLPQSYISKFIDKQTQIYAKDSIYLKKYMVSGKVDPATFKATTVATSPKGSGKVVVVKKGETLGAIASRNKCTVAQIAKWNGIKSSSPLRIGQKIKILK